MVEIVPEITKESIINLAVNDKREDGRELDEYRDISIETDVISKAEGSARVKNRRYSGYCRYQTANWCTISGYS